MNEVATFLSASIFPFIKTNIMLLDNPRNIVKKFKKVFFSCSLNLLKLVLECVNFHYVYLLPALMLVILSFEDEKLKYEIS